MKIENFFAPCPRGLEAVLCDELGEIGTGDAFAMEGGVAFSCSWDTACRVNLESRIASRILWKVLEAPYRTEDDIYKAASSLSWEDWFSPELTIKVNLAATKSPLKSLDFATLRIKDGICDRFRQKTGRRPSIDTSSPDMRIHAHLTSNTFSLYIDMSGESLFKRGLRHYSVEAPLRENLAAGILRLAGWKPGIPLLDPMCGSGTFLLEAAQSALGIAPGSRRNFAFEKLLRFDAKKWEDMRQASIARQKPPEALPIYGSDIAGRAVESARKNLNEAGLEGVVQLKQANFIELPPPIESGIIVTNPPYGVRIGSDDELARLYPLIGNALKEKYAGWTAYFFTADLRLAKLIRLSATRRTPLYNGALECRLFEYRMVSGTNRKA